MRTILLLFSVLTVAYSSSNLLNQDWSEEYLVSPGYVKLPSSVAIQSESTILFVYDQRSEGINITRNGGKTWQRLTESDPATFQTICMADFGPTGIGVVGGMSGYGWGAEWALLHTSDGGRTWLRSEIEGFEQSADSTQMSVTQVRYPDRTRSNVQMVAASGSLQRKKYDSRQVPTFMVSHDYGITFSSFQLQQQRSYLSSRHIFSDGDTWLVVSVKESGSGHTPKRTYYLWRITESGAKQELLTESFQNSLWLQCSTGRGYDCWLRDGDGIVYKTSNGGVMWREWTRFLPPNVQAKHLRQLRCITGSTCWAVSSSRFETFAVDFTSDGGQSWRRVVERSQGSFGKLEVAEDGSHGLIVYNKSRPQYGQYIIRYHSAATAMKG